MDLKILNLCYSDYANFMHDHSNALRSVGLDVIDIKLKPHDFNYPSQSKIVKREDFGKYIKDADIIQMFHSCRISLAEVRKYKKSGAKVIVWHTGSPYRTEPDVMNRAFNGICDLTLTDQCEFMFLGAKNIHYMATAVNTKAIAYTRKGISKPLIFAHYPSSPFVKGTEDIIRMIQPYDNSYGDRMKFIHDITKVPFDQQLKRMQQCDIYIELFKPTLLGKPYGCYGVTAFEGASLGKIVITNNIFPTTYFNAYGINPPFIIANNEREFKEKVLELIFMPSEQILSLQDSARQWIEKYHSYEATGNHWKKVLSL